MVLRPLQTSRPWPSFRKPQHTQLSANIDDEPFQYFISDPFQDCETVPVSSMASQALSPPRRLSSPATRFKEWIWKLERRLFHRKTLVRYQLPPPPLVSHDAPKLSEPRLLSSPPLRGRGDVRVGSANRAPNTARNRPRRPRSWRPPSGEIWPVAEEEEVVGLRITTE